MSKRTHTYQADSLDPSFNKRSATLRVTPEPDARCRFARKHLGAHASEAASRRSAVRAHAN
jgi:hypothetical protein